MSLVTFGTLVERLARFAGKAGVCSDSEEAKMFALEILEEYLNSGGEKGGNNRSQTRGYPG